MSERAFDPGDEFDAMAESFRRQVADMAINALKITAYRDLHGYRQIECFMAGVATGLIGVCFAHIQPEGRDEMMRAIEQYLPQARENVEGIIATPAQPSRRGADHAGDQKV